MEPKKLIKSRRDFPSSDQKNTVAGWFYEPCQTPVKAIVQLSHGMCEYIGRYDELADWLCRHGYAVCGNDHLGHGATSDGQNGVDGYMGPKNGWRYVLEDLHQMTALAKQWKPGVPVVLLGHSMGSFYARAYAARWGSELAGLVLCGTAGKNPAAAAGLAITHLLAKMRGPTYRSSLVNRLAFGAYLKRIEKPRTPYDWISRDQEVVARYAKDPKCTFVFTVSGFHDLMNVLQQVSGEDWAQKLPKQLPVFLLAGDADPVGDYGKGVKAVYHWLLRAKLQNLTLKLYPGARHELFNETCRKQVFRDVTDWLERCVPAADCE